MLRTLIVSSVLVLLAQTAVASIYTCTDKNGRRHNSDRPIVDCLDQQQRILKPDGSLKTIVQPAMSPQERGVAEAREREAERGRRAEQEKIKRDRMLLRRYPNPATHQAARVEALRLVNTSLEATQHRIQDLQNDRKPLTAEAARLGNKALPADLKQKLNANEAMQKAQQSLVQNQTSEADRINQRYDDEVARLAPLWKGLAPARSSTNGDPR